MGSKGGGGGSAPAPPNYQALIGQQGATNYGQWLNQLYAGRPDQSNPYGSTQWNPPPMPAPSSGGATPMGAMATRGGGTPTNSLGSATNTGATGLYGGAIPAPTGQWGQQSSFSAPIQGVVNPLEQGAAGAAASFNPANNPTWQGPTAGNVSALQYNAPTAASAMDLSYNGPQSAGMLGYGGPTSAGDLSYNGPQSANFNYSGPQNAGMLGFNPAQTAQGLYGGVQSLLEPGMQSQSNALDQSLKAQGYDVNSAGGAQTAENNLQNQQNLERTQTADWAVGQAIPQGAMALQAQESIPQVQQQIAQGNLSGNIAAAQGEQGIAQGALQSNAYIPQVQQQIATGALGAQESIPQVQQNIAQGAFGAGLGQLSEAGMLGNQQFQDLLSQVGMGGNIGSQQFQAGMASQQLPLQEAQSALSGALAPSGAIPGGAAQAPGMAGVDVTGPAQQSYANQVGTYNAQQANQANFWNGLMGLGGSGALAYALM